MQTLVNEADEANERERGSESPRISHIPNDFFEGCFIVERTEGDSNRSWTDSSQLMELFPVWLKM